MKNSFFTILLFLPGVLFAQTDSLKGDIKSIREKLIFLDSTQQNIKFFYTEGDYGHYGFSSPEFTFLRFNSLWFTTPWVHYLNYKRNYDKAKNLTNETWYYKNDAPVEQYIYEYDKRDNLVQTKTVNNDSTYSVKNFFYDDLNLLRSSIFYSSNRLDNYVNLYFSYGKYLL